MTLPNLRKAYYAARREMIEREIAKGISQTEAAKNLGVTRQCLSNILKRDGIYWPDSTKWQRNT